MDEKLIEGAQLISLKMVREQVPEYENATKAVKDVKDAVEMFESVFALSLMAEEAMCMITLSTANRPTGFWIISVGSLNESLVHPREVYKRALLSNSCNIILAHNHPSGDPELSVSDRKLLARLLEAGKVMGVKLLDFIAVGSGGEFVSAQKRGLMGS